MSPLRRGFWARLLRRPKSDWIDHIKFSEWCHKPPNDRSQIEAVEAHLGRSLPTDLCEFLSAVGPGEGLIGEAYVVIHDAQELLQVNRELQVAEYAPGLFVFGGDGGGEGIAFDFSREDAPGVVVPYIGLSREDAIPAARSFRELMEHLSSGADLG